MRLFISIFISFFVLLISTNAQNRYAENQVTMDHDTMFLKKEMHKINGIVYNEYGEIGNFLDGFREGIHKEWFRSGNVKDEITYLKGQKEGGFKYWDDKGQLLKEGYYKSNKLEGLVKEWYHNGNIKLEVRYKKGEMHGLRTEWYKSGHKWSEQQMENGYVISGKHFYNDGSEITHGSLIKH
jgi:antitoxin component YwqK of YwqJK toxin-antitoxin module